MARLCDAPKPSIIIISRAMQAAKHPFPVQAHDPNSKFRKLGDTVLSMSPHTASHLEEARRAFKPSVPSLLLGVVKKKELEATTSTGDTSAIKKSFPCLYGQSIVELLPDASGSPGNPLKVGCVLSGGQAAGGHNCICGLYDYVTTHFPGSTVYGFIGGPKGVMTNAFKVLDAATIDEHRNSGGFTMLASGRDKIESAEQFERATATARDLGLDGLVVIGGDDSNTNACLVRAKPSPGCSCLALTLYVHVRGRVRVLMMDMHSDSSPSTTRRPACPRASSASQRQSTAT